MRFGGIHQKLFLSVLFICLAQAYILGAATIKLLLRVLVYAQEFSRNVWLSSLTRHQIPRTTKNPLEKLKKLWLLILLLIDGIIVDTNRKRSIAQRCFQPPFRSVISWAKKDDSFDSNELAQKIIERKRHAWFAMRLCNATHGLRFLDTWWTFCTN